MARPKYRRDDAADYVRQQFPDDDYMPPPEIKSPHEVLSGVDPQVNAIIESRTTARERRVSVTRTMPRQVARRGGGHITVEFPPTLEEVQAAERTALVSPLPSVPRSETPKRPVSSPCVLPRRGRRATLNKLISTLDPDLGARLAPRLDEYADYDDWYVPYDERVHLELSDLDVSEWDEIENDEYADLYDGTSQAEVIRRAIRLYEPERRGDRDFALIGSGDGPGDSIADLPEEDLLEGFGA